MMWSQSGPLKWKHSFRGKLEVISIIPNIQKLVSEDSGDSVLKLLPKGTIIWSDNLNYSIDRINDIYNGASEKIISELVQRENFTRKIYCSIPKKSDCLLDHVLNKWNSDKGCACPEVLNLNTAPQPVFKNKLRITFPKPL